MPVDFDKEKWLDTYASAIVELAHAKMLDKIADAHTEIINRVAELAQVPGLHAVELHAIQDALENLRVLTEEEERYNTQQKHSALEQVGDKLRIIAPAIYRLNTRRPD